MTKATQYLHLTAASIFALLPVQAAAQDQQETQQVPVPTTDDANSADSDIVVSGTRITRNGANAPTPVSVITSEEIDRAAPTTIADYVNQQPALFGSSSPRNTNSVIAGGFAGANILNLRNLGSTRTLTLFNGRRLSPSFLTGVTDINTLPNSLIKRVDIVTGGASAAWGSDAVSGVVNFVLDEQFSGIKLSAQGGQTFQNDGETYSTSAAFGTGFADGRGHILLSANFSKTKRAIAADRDWFEGYKILANPAFSPGNGQPARLMLSNSSVLANASGLIASGPLRGLQFNADGQPLAAPFDFGDLVVGILASGADTDDPARFAELQSPLNQKVGFGRLSYELTDGIEVYGEIGYAKSRSTVFAATFAKLGNASVAIDNPYLAQSVKDRMVLAGVTALPLSTTLAHYGNPQGIYDRVSWRYLAGFKAEFAAGWTADGYAQRGDTDIGLAIVNNFNSALYNLAIDTVLNNGQIVCRSTLTNPGNGCIPINPLGTAPLTAAQSAYFGGTAVQNQAIRQDVAAITLNGDLFQLPAGTVSLAIGGEYRKESAVADADAVSIANGYYVGNYKPFKGSYSLKEIFGEIAVPVLKDSAIGNLDLNGAVRLTDYSTSGTVETWKLGFTYEPSDEIRIRATRSRDVRAPNLNELFLGGQVMVILLNDPQQGNAPTLARLVNSGNNQLAPEKADTQTAGIVYQPGWLPGFEATLDFYDIKIKNAIFTPSATQVLTQCNVGNVDSCALISRDSGGVLTEVRSVPINARSERARGIDFELGYRHEVGNMFSDEPAQIEFRVFGNYVDKLRIADPLLSIRREGEVGTNLGSAQGVPRFRGLATLGYNSNPITVQFKARFIGAAKVEADWGPLDINRNRVPAIFYLDAFLGYDFKVAGGKAQIFAAVDNLFDTDPPVAVSLDNNNVLSAGTSTTTYDTLGRAWRIGARIQF